MTEEHDDRTGPISTTKGGSGQAAQTQSTQTKSTQTDASQTEADGEDASVVIRDVKKSFGKHTVLDGLTLDFKTDAITSIIGPSGTGKSVLLKHVVGLLEPDEGDILVFDQDIWKISERERQELRKSFGVLFQDGALFGSMNIYDNVAFPLRKHTTMREDDIKKTVMESLDEVGLTDAIDRAPGECSGGMKKRAGFARALVMNPSIVMFDEPDSGLDPVRTDLLNDLILKIHGEHGGTYVLVTHDIETAKKCSDYIGVLYEGSMIHYGPMQEAFESESDFVRQFLAGTGDGPLGMD